MVISYQVEILIANEGKFYGNHLHRNRYNIFDVPKINSACRGSAVVCDLALSETPGFLTSI